MSLTLAVQKAVIGALEASLATGVYARAPDGAALPYVTVGPVLAVPRAGQIEADADEITVYLTAWSDAPGNAEVEGILESIRDTLDHARLALETGHMAAAYVTRRSSEPDIDEATFMGRATLRVLATR